VGIAELIRYQGLLAAHGGAVFSFLVSFEQPFRRFFWIFVLIEIAVFAGSLCIQKFPRIRRSAGLLAALGLIVVVGLSLRAYAQIGCSTKLTLSLDPPPPGPKF
jgi:hypothetical protein